MSSLGDSSTTSREQRRDERKRRRNAQDSSVKQKSSEKKEKTPGREDRKKKTDFTSSNGGSSAQKKVPSGSKRLSYDKVNIIEKTSKFDTPAEKENKGEKANEGTKPESAATRRKLGSKFLDNLSKFETKAKQIEETKKEPFVRSFSAQSSNNDSSFRRSYRPPRSAPSVEDPSILVRRSLRKERVLESIAKLEKQSTRNTSSLKKKPASPSRQRSDDNKAKISSRPSSASSSRTSLSDSASSTGSTKGLTRAQQALERHKNRMRKTSQTSTSGTTPSPIKTPSSPAMRSRSFASDTGRKTPGKSKTKTEEKAQKTEPADESPTRKISVTKNPLEGDKVEVTTVAEIETPSDGKMSVVVKECTFSEEEMEKLISPTESTDYTLGDDRPMSVEDAVAIFDLEEDKPLSPVPMLETEDPPAARTRRKLPELPVQSPKRSRKKHSKKKKTSEDGSGEPSQEVVVIETTPTFQDDIPMEISPSKSEKNAFLYNFNQNSSNIEEATMKYEEVSLKHEPNSLKQDQKSPKRKPKSPKQSKKSLKQDKKLPEQEFIIVEREPIISPDREFKIISFEPILPKSDKKSMKHDQKSPEHDPKSLKHEQESFNCEEQKTPTFSKVSLHEPITVEPEHTRVALTIEEPIILEKETAKDVLEENYTPEDAIQVLRRLSEEVVHSAPIKSNDRSPVTETIVTSSIKEDVEELTKDQDIGTDNTTNKKRRSKKKRDESNRPTSLHIEEVLYISDETRPKSISPTKSSPRRASSEAKQIPSPKRSPKIRKKDKKSPSHSKELKRGSTSSEILIPQEDSTKKVSPEAKSPVKSLKRGSTSPEIFFLPQDSPNRVLVQTTSPKSIVVKTPESPKKSTPKSPLTKEEIVIKTPQSPLKTLQSPIKTPGSPVKTLRSPVKVPGSPVKTPDSPVKAPESPVKAPESPVKAPGSPVKAPGSPTKAPGSPVKTPKSPVKAPDSPVKVPGSPIKLPGSPVKVPGSPVKQSFTQEASVTEVPQVNTSVSQTKVTETQMRDEIKMIGSKSIKPRVTKAKKTWVDESESDDALILSDAGSDASDIDVDWLGTDSEDDSPKKKVTKPRAGSSGIQRSASKAQDMLKMWEKKAAEPKLKASPARQTGKLGNSIAAWQNKSSANGVRDSSSESLSEESNSEKSNKAVSNPSTPVHRSLSIRNGNRPVSTSEYKVKEEETKIQDIFDSKVAGKIQGAKAMFENLSHSPVRSPSFQRSPRKQIEIKPRESPEDSPVLSRKSSLVDAAPTSRKSSASRKQIEIKPRESPEDSPVLSRKSSLVDAAPTSRKSSESDGSSCDANEMSDGAEESLKVDNMRALFEKQANKKQDYRKQKTSLAEMVDNDCDITDVRSVKAMWESMDNHRSPRSAEKKSKGKSNIQKKVASRKKGRRSMTQPVTSDDVMKAETMINQSDNIAADADEEPLNFKDRLKFFSQLSNQPKSKPKARVRRLSDSQPVKSIHIGKAAEFLEAKQEKVEKPKPSKLNSDIFKKISTPSPEPIKLPPAPVHSPRSPTFSKPKARNISITSSSDTESLLSSSSTSIDDSEPGRKKLLLSSTDSSSSSNEMSVDVAEIKSAGSIHERLQRLQRNKTEEKWKKQKQNSEIKSSVSERLNKLKSQEDKWKKPSGSSFANRAEKLSERIAKIKEDSMTWKEKTGKQNDAAQFTVQAKLAKREGKTAIAVLPSPPIKRRVLPVILPTNNATVTEKDTKHQRNDSASMNQLSFVEKLANKGLEENVLKTTETKTTEVPEFDHNEFEKFFGSTPEILTNGDTVDIEIDVLPEVKTTSKLSDIGRLKTGVQRKNKRKATARNPVKALAARTDIKQSYETSRSNVAKLEQQRIAVQRGNAANFTSAALAGLATKADLKNVNLRSTKNTPMPSNDDLRPFQDVMLLRAKGRRQVQTRLVDPCPASLCSDDAFLLITPNKLFAWFGEFCNVIERAKINEIADYIVIKGDLGCKVSSLNSIEEYSDPKRQKEFWNFLGGHDEWDKTTQQGWDEQYEVDVESTIKTYKMIESKLVPHEEAWGKFPKMSMLGSNDTFVFDFGAEMYIWQGKDVSFADRRLAVRLARVLWEQDYDFTEQGICPFHVKQLKGKRPKFGLFSRVNENLETSLFQEKFEDWSNIHREVGEEEAIMRETSRGKAVVEQETKSSIATEMEAYDVTKMIENKPTPVPLFIEGCDISKGDGNIVDEDGRILEIVTSDVETFHVTENNVEKFTDSVLHRSNTYVVKWKYSISSTGKFEKSKEGKASASDVSNGRQRVAYFSWAGPDSPASEKGASALIASSMDTDDGPIINVEEGTAPPVFNECFKGNLVIVDGKRGNRRGAFNWKLFQVKGDSAESAALVEVPSECKSLRSCSSFVAMIPRDATAIVWHGCRSPKNVREAVEEAINKMSERMPESIPFRKNPTCLKISICEEGKESDLFWEAVGIKRRNRYECLLDETTETRITRAWKFITQSESFVADEIQQVNSNTLFPLVQEQLFDVEKPSLILLDSTHGVFLWQNCDSDKLNGSAKRRWDVIRRLSMETTIKYCKEHSREEARLIEAGFEPMSITNAFQCWKVKEKTTFEQNILKKPKLVSEILSTLTRLTYTLEELRGPELPDGVDARHLESYLSNSEFENLFDMTKKEYYQMPVWKQKQLRQEKKFF